MASARTHRTRKILSLTTGQPIASAGFTGPDCGAMWDWISSVVADYCECDPEAVAVLEDPDRGDVLTADGVPVFILC